MTTLYQPQAIDTSAEADQLLFKLLRQKTSAQRLEIASAQNRCFRDLFLAGLRRRFSELTPDIVATAFLKDSYPDGFRPKGSEMTWIQDSIGLAAQLHLIFEELGIPYYVTGGLAAITYGEYRTTQDVDVVIDASLKDIPRLVIRLEQAGFYIPGIEDVQAGRMRTLSITHIETIARADLVVADSNAFEGVKFKRRQQIDIPGRVSLFFVSAEDLVLNKLQWRRHTQSEKQWRDILGVLKTQSSTLDMAYMRKWAKQLGVEDDLAEALQCSGLEDKR
ncbi:MAG: hypothetical protein HC886_03005 [Leptolyngbyaceae cyanobacterium SM1_1_3]|nr:hypothetical protein [Leptolyngbyaceae cyanobacterium SM1_1_3]NJN04399.1 hypothetical protein [Leptolyngbyaceae cyanobacterium RM1_1_2]NJO11925.1 hypothetical protein [Leptolyngbyaceae cyanobacterium SL_1_1]